MPVKLICTIILMVLVAVFTGFNLDHSCPIWPISNLLGLGDIPVCVTILASFVLGVLVTLPFTFGKRAPRAAKPPKAKKGGKKKVDGIALQESVLPAESPLPPEA